MATKLVYLDDTYLFSGSSKVIGKGRAEKGGFIELDETIFYPQGGGQQSDIGYFVIDGDEVPVTFVGFDNGVVQHFVPETYFEKIVEGSAAEMSVNEESRLRNSKLHSSGHLISHIFETINPNLVPVKGYHFGDGAYVEFLDEARVGSAEMLDEVNQSISDAIKCNLKILAALSDYEEVSSIRPNLAPYIPKDKPTRVVRIGEYVGLPCGGTHVRSTGELIDLKVTKIRRKKDNLKVSYAM